MIKVEFKNHWFDGAKLWEPGVQEVPENLKDILPSTAVILKEDGSPNKAANDKKDKEAEKVKEETKDSAEPNKTEGKVDNKGDLKL
jgi:hypothetical protein